MFQRTYQVSSTLLTVLSLLASFNLAAQTHFVTDDFEVMLRTGPSIQNKIIKPLRSGTSIEILREDSGKGHSQVRTSDGEIWYILRRFITDQPSARRQLSRVQNQLEERRSSPTELQTLLAAAQEENRELINQNVGLTDELKSLSVELAKIKEVSGDVVGVADKNQKLESEVRELLLQLDDIRIQNEALKDNSETMRNLIGAGLIILGLFLGWVLSISGRRNRGSWGA